MADFVSLYTELPIDFHGQQLAESVINKVFAVAVVVSFLVGFVLGDVKYLAASFGVFIVIAWLAVLPNWPVYNKNPPQWLKVEYDF